MTKTEKYLIEAWRQMPQGIDREYADILSYVETAARIPVFGPRITYAQTVKDNINVLTDADLLALDSIY